MVYVFGGTKILYLESSCFQRSINKPLISFISSKCFSKVYVVCKFSASNDDNRKSSWTQFVFISLKSVTSYAVNDWKLIVYKIYRSFVRYQIYDIDIHRILTVLMNWGCKIFYFCRI